MTTGGALMVCGSASAVGKSTIAGALCRSWARRGVRVAPFKAWNMSNHAAVTDDGGEAARAQAVQAAAARAPLERRMNPLLVKPSTRHGAHLVVMGDEVAAGPSGGERGSDLRDMVLNALVELRGTYELVVAEGAGGAAEINLMDSDIVNLPLAAAAGIPAILVVDIDRGGAFAAAHGTLSLLDPRLREQVKGAVFNRFRGDPGVLMSGVEELERRTRVPFLGVLPHLGPARLLGSEDSLDVELGTANHPDQRWAQRGWAPIRVAALRLPHLSNPTDLDPFLVEPDVELRWVTAPEEVAAADLVVIPGSRATVDDLDWMRRRGLADAVMAADGFVVGICGGYQMLGGDLDDPVESGRGLVHGLGLLDAETRFVAPEVVEQVTGETARGSVRGYRVHWGRVTFSAEPWFAVDGRPEGCVGSGGRVVGTSVHGVFDGDEFRSAFLSAVAADRDREYRPADIGFAATMDAQHERLADWVDEALDLDVLDEIAATAVAVGQTPGWL